MPEQTDYFDKYLQAQFTQINNSIGELKGQFTDLRNEVKEEIAEVKADNKNTRRWIFGTVIGTGITVLLGLATILFTFVQIQNSWMQQVISFVSKAIIK